MDNISVKISKKLSYYLRHGLIKHNIPHDSNGFVNINDIFKLDSIFDNIDIELINQIVSNDSKNRFELKIVNNNIYIRANQGHSSGNLKDDNMLEILKKPIEGCFHGTYKKNLESIKKYGLSKMKRKHIHIAESMDAKSGKRNNCNLIIYINMKLAMDDGIRFYKSSNGVILTPGNDDGYLVSKYLIFI